MNKTLQLSFALRDTYRVNSILYSIKQLPLIKKILPDTLYQVAGLKVLAHVISAIWELVSVFLGKGVYLLLVYSSVSLFFGEQSRGALLLHVLFCLTLVGSFVNTSLFDPTRDKYYAIILLRMDATAYTLVNYTYAMVKVAVGFLPFTLLFGLRAGLPLYLCLLLPLGVVGCKMTAVALTLSIDEKRGGTYNENKLGKPLWVLMALLLAAAYALPAVGLALSQGAYSALFLLMLPLGALSARKIYTFPDYRQMSRELLCDQGVSLKKINTDVARKSTTEKIDADAAITSSRSGFEFLNELFIRRHRKILWKSASKLSLVLVVILAALALTLIFVPQLRPDFHHVLSNRLPYLAFLLYAINRGTGFTQALFINCDHSLLTYSFYKKPRCILQLFRIRLREIMKINAVPAAILGVGLALIFHLCGGSADLTQYLVLLVTPVAMSLFFSVHYLTLYYLLQPYNAGTELKSGTYRLMLSVTYLVCYFMMQLRVPSLVFGGLCIVFCLVYSLVACLLVYRLAPRTFRLRS